MHQDLDFALDLLVARAALDEELQEQLLKNPEECCHRNGIELPAGARLVITHPEQEVLVRAIPMNTAEAALSKADQSTRELESAHFNSAVVIEMETEMVITSTTTSDEVQAQTTTETAANAQTQAVVSVVAC